MARELKQALYCRACETVVSPSGREAHEALEDHRRGVRRLQLEEAVPRTCNGPCFPVTARRFID